jgi:hypothetical protein
MSLQSLAMMRKNAGHELAQLADDHLNHDLQQSDRDALKSATQKFSTYTNVGSLLGLGLCVALAFRVRKVRAEYFKAFRAMERPTKIMFADGRTGWLTADCPQVNLVCRDGVLIVSLV